MFTSLCGGTFTLKFVDPFDNSHNIFVLFNCLHIFILIIKLYQTDCTQTFHLPDFSDLDIIITAIVSDFKTFLNIRQDRVVTLSPA